MGTGDNMKYPIFFVAVLILCITVSAIPATQPATAIGNNNVTLNGNGVTGTTGWFQWAMKSGVVYAHLPNVTASGGVMNYTIRGTPLFGSTTYYYKACDPSGCGAEVSFTTLQVTPLPTPAINGVAIDTYTNDIISGGFYPPNVIYNSMRPYMAITTDTIFYGIIFAIIFVGMWLRTRGTATATIFGMICLMLFTISVGGLGIGLPPEFLAVGQALMYLSLTGAILAFTFK